MADELLSSQEPDEEFLAWLRASCEASGVPLKVQDPTVIRRVAAILSTARLGKPGK